MISKSHPTTSPFYLSEIGPVLCRSLGEGKENVSLALIVVIIENNLLDEIAREGDEECLKKERMEMIVD